MTDIIDINDHRPHTAMEVICIKCHHRYFAVFPTTTMLKDLECDNCGVGFIIGTGQELDQENDT